MHRGKVSLNCVFLDLNKQWNKFRPQDNKCVENTWQFMITNFLQYKMAYVHQLGTIQI